ncbi:MAG: PH domain-containing protein [Deltaproteobacteria bacterium]|nr:PH domain-containing protein [Deltaproteobacteria bacterium]
MGTRDIPDSKRDGELHRDVPRIGKEMWVLLFCFLLPPAGVTLVGNATGALPHQTLWVVLLSCPVFVILITLPRRYEIHADRLAIVGVYYRYRIPFDDLSEIRAISPGRALLHPGSLFCSDPGKALALDRLSRRTLVISPSDPESFRKVIEQRLHEHRVAQAQGASGKEGG